SWPTFAVVSRDSQPAVATRLVVTGQLHSPLPRRNPSGVRQLLAALMFDIFHHGSPLRHWSRSGGVLAGGRQAPKTPSSSLARKRPGVRISSAPCVVISKASKRRFDKRF